MYIIDFDIIIIFLLINSQSLGKICQDLNSIDMQNSKSKMENGKWKIYKT